MKYQRLTKEQLEELRPEFINFLATQSIIAEEWNDIKTKKTKVAEEEIDIFSDLVWEEVLSKATYLEHFSKDQIHLFHLRSTDMHLIAIKINNAEIDVMTNEGYQWLRENLMDDQVIFYNAHKEYGKDPALDVFRLIQQGANITAGKLYHYFEKIIGDTKNKS